MIDVFVGGSQFGDCGFGESHALLDRPQALRKILIPRTRNRETISTKGFQLSSFIESLESRRLMSVAPSVAALGTEAKTIKAGHIGNALARLFTHGW